MRRRWSKKSKSVLLLISVVLLVILTPVAMYFSHDVDRLNHEYPKVVFDGDDVDYEFQLKAPAYWVRLDQISSYGRWAITLSEDWGFWKHEGVDYEELSKVIDESIKQQRFIRGASTISQQVVKNVFLSSWRSVFRKLHEIILTHKMEKVVPKKKILEVYFNIVEFGPKVYGIRQASYYYFKKHPSALNPREAAFLAMLLPSPKRYSESFRKRTLTRFARGRVRAILQKMKWAKIISEEQRQMWGSSKFSWEY